MPKNELPPSNETEKLLTEKANFISVKNLYVFLKNTKKKGTDFQKQVLSDIFKQR
jgi:hypothetical protein